MLTPTHSPNTAATGGDQHKLSGSATSQPKVEQMPHSPVSPNGGTYIGKTLLIKGEVSGSEPLYIEGRVEGSIMLPGSQVCIGRDGAAAATVEAAEVVVRGKLLGKLKASGGLKLHNGSSVAAEMAAPRISIEDGAQLQGTIDMPQLVPASQPQREMNAPPAAREEQASSDTNEAEPSPALATH